MLALSLLYCSSLHFLCEIKPLLVVHGDEGKKKKRFIREEEMKFIRKVRTVWGNVE